MVLLLKTILNILRQKHMLSRAQIYQGASFSTTSVLRRRLRTNDGLKIILPCVLYDLSITIYPLHLTRNKAMEKTPVLLMALHLRAQTLEWGWKGIKRGWKGDEMSQRGLAAFWSLHLYVYSQCITACLDFVHSFLFPTDYRISETQSVFNPHVESWDVPT